MLTCLCSGARTRIPTRKDLTPSRLIALRVLRLLVTLALLRHSSHNMVVSENNKSLDGGCMLIYSSAGQQYGGQQGNFAGQTAQSPATYGGQPPMGYAAPPSAGGYGRGQQTPTQQWTPQGPPAQNFNNGFQGYQG